MEAITQSWKCHFGHKLLLRTFIVLCPRPKFSFRTISIFLTIQPVITCTELTIETLQEGVFIVNFGHISHLVLVLLLLTLSR